MNHKAKVCHFDFQKALKTQVLFLVYGKNDSFEVCWQPYLIYANYPSVDVNLVPPKSIPKPNFVILIFKKNLKGRFSTCYMAKMIVSRYAGGHT